MAIRPTSHRKDEHAMPRMPRVGRAGHPAGQPDPGLNQVILGVDTHKDVRMPSDPGGLGARPGRRWREACSGGW